MKALGITALVFSIISVFVPFIGAYLTIVCALLAAFSAGPGIAFGFSAIGINILSIIFLSPSIWMAAGFAEMEQEGTANTVLLGIGGGLILVQVVAAIILSVVHYLWKRKQASEAAL